MPWRFNNRGFTLIEVLIALVILSLVGVVLLQTTQTSTDQSRYLANKVIATWVAKDRVTAMRLSLRQGQSPELGDQRVEQAGRQWLTRIQLSKQTALLDRIEVQVFLGSEMTPMYRLSSYLPHLGDRQ